MLLIVGIVLVVVAVLVVLVSVLVVLAVIVVLAYVLVVVVGLRDAGATGPGPNFVIGAYFRNRWC